LVVEDDVLLLKGIKEILELSDYRVLTATDGYWALSVLHSQAFPPDLIVSDTDMPRLDGYNFFKAVRSKNKLVKTPFIFLVSKRQTRLRKAVNIGADDYIVKPFDAEDLLVSIESKLDRKLQITRCWSGEISDITHDLLTTVKRELRLPMDSMLSLIEEMRETDQLSKENMRVCLAGIRDAARRMRIFMENSLVFAEFETGEAEATFASRKHEVDNYGALVKAWREKYQEIADERKVTLQAEFEPNIPIAVIDPEYLTIAVECLLDNAIKFSNKPNSTVCLRLFTDNHWLCISVKDQGPGIVEYEWESVFEGFYRIKRYDFEPLGAGLGLAIVDRATKLHRGWLSFESRMGEGTTFIIHIPTVNVMPKGEGSNTAKSNLPSMFDRSRDRLLYLKGPLIANVDELSSSLTKEFIVQFEMLKNTLSHLERIRNLIAQLSPNFIIIESNSINEDLRNVLRQLKEFDLYESIPKVLITKHPPYPGEYRVLFDRGIDQICGFSKEELKESIEQSNRQYQNPPVFTDTGASVITLSHDEDLNMAIWNFFNNYGIHVIITDTPRRCTRSAKANQNGLYILDDAFLDTDFLQELHSCAPDATIILVSDQEISNGIFDNQHRYGIQGFLLKPIDVEQLQIIFSKLQRWYQPPDLKKIWSDCQCKVQELLFETEVRHKYPDWVGAICEATAHNTDLVHDLRNSLFSLDLVVHSLQYTEREKDASAILEQIECFSKYSNFLFEVSADLRFKGNWSPKLCPNEKGQHSLASLLVEGIALAHYVQPQVTFHLQEPLFQENPVLILDTTQIQRALSALLIACAQIGIDPYLNIRNYCTSHSVLIIVSKPNWKKRSFSKYLMPVRAESVTMTELLLLVAKRIVHRHGGQLFTQGNRFVLALSTGGWSSDETLRHQIADLSTQRQKLERKIDLLSRSTSSLEVTPVIIEPVEIMIKELMKIISLAPQLGESGQQLRLSARHSVLLARNFLMGRTEIQPELSSIQLQSIFDTVLLLCKDYLLDCQTKIYVAPETSCVLADELGLLQMLINLVNNAVQAMDGAGDLNIIAEPHPEGVLISISDTGCGIPSENQNRIFDLAFTTKEGHERGIGLHIVQNIVKQFHGSIQVRSIVGVGSTFEIILPKGIPDEYTTPSSSNS
jgi:signal transduction histidine kinase